MAQWKTVPRYKPPPTPAELVAQEQAAKEKEYAKWLRTCAVRLCKASGGERKDGKLDEAKLTRIVGYLHMGMDTDSLAGLAREFEK